MRTRAAWVVLVMVLGIVEARAQVAAGDPPVPRSTVARGPRTPHPPGGLGASLAFGTAGDGWVGRLEFEALPVMAPHGANGPLVGFAYALEYWRTDTSSGFALPFVVMLGAKVFPIRASLGLGVNAITIESLDGDRGVGLYQPLANANVGLDIYGFRIAGDARVTRHWLIGAPDFTQWQFTISAGYTLGTRRKRPYY